MIYSRAEDPKTPIKKWVLEVNVLDGGSYYIDAMANTYEQKQDLPGMPGKKKMPDTGAAPKPRIAGGGDGEGPEGYFASMVTLKRSKKKKK